MEAHKKAGSHINARCGGVTTLVCTEGSGDHSGSVTNMAGNILSPDIINQFALPYQLEDKLLPYEVKFWHGFILVKSLF